MDDIKIPTTVFQRLGLMLCFFGLHSWAPWGTRVVDGALQVVSEYCRRPGCGLIRDKVVPTE